MKAKFSERYNLLQADVKKCIDSFENTGELVYGGDRNSIKTFDIGKLKLNVKSFKVPNIINQVVYKFFRKSKAQRSFEYANKLTELGIGTPLPIAYYEFETSLLFKRSYYVSEHLKYDLTYRELTRNLDYPDHEKILRAFTRFTFKLHEKGINFLDHSPGNTLIVKTDEDYRFYLVDLNRMEFKAMDFDTRIKNFSRLTTHESIVKIMSDEYAKHSGDDYDKIYSRMWNLTQKFQERFYRKIRLKKKLKFWKNNN